MTNQQILEKAIQKAIDGGWKLPKHGYKIWLPVGKLEPLVVLYEDFDIEVQYNLQAIIFNHDFAKALWGEQLQVWQVEGYRAGATEIEVPSWQVNLQRMVISTDPIKYLGEHI